MPSDRRQPRIAEVPQMAPGAVVADKYVVEDVLGSGAMGFVMSATHKLIGQKVAIKFVKAAYVQSEDALARFKREARALVAVQSENVVRVFDYGTLPDETPYLVMEYLRGRDLQKELRARGRIPLEEAAEIVVQACEGLAAVHARGIVHRDIKPANLFLTQRANGKRLVKIVDFGISKAPKTHDDDDLPITKGSIGSPHYMSPEQLRNSLAVDARSDVWSLGVTLYRALTGELPFGGESVASLLAAVVSEEPRRLRQGRPELPAEVEAIVTKCLEKNAENRFASAEELADALAPLAMPTERGPGSGSDRPESAPELPDSALLQDSTSRAHVALISGPGAPASLPEWKPRLALAAAIGVPLVLVTLALRFASQGEREPSRSVAAASSSVTTITDLPTPKTSNPTAAASYMGALQGVRDASFVDALNGFARAAALDPTMAAAHLRSALYGGWLVGTEPRRHARVALALRASLTERDRELLDAAEPLYLPPQPAFDEAQGPIDRLVASRPGDAELAFLSGLLFLGHRPHAEILRLADRALEKDPRFAGAVWLRALVSQIDSDRAAARRSVDQCLAISPAAASCLRVRATIEDVEGDCAGLQADADRMVAMEEGSYRAHDFLALALFARGATMDSVRESFARKWKASPERSRSSVVLLDEARLAIAQGDFATALRSALELDRLAQAGGTEQDRGTAAALLIDLDAELGDVAGAAQVADAYLRRVGAWPASDSITDDLRPRLYAAAVRGGLRTAEERDRERGQWSALWNAQTQPSDRALVWLEGYAAPAQTRDEAEAALAALPDYAPLASLTLRGWTVPAMAKVHALAGRWSEALPELRLVTSSCHALADPLAYVRTELAFGEALEASGATEGACAAYRAVLQRWGGAKRSVTAAAASAHERALGCPR
jgi:serine/threonine protein kinase